MSDFNINSVLSNCNKNLGVILEQNNLNENPDGTLSAYFNNVGGKKPYEITKTCCEVLRDITGKTYYYDLDEQKCRWKEKTVNCVDIEPIKIILNPKGNDGNIFNVDEGENCTLNVNFEYLFKINCESLSNLLTSEKTYDPKLYEEINNLQNELEFQTLLCEELGVNISALTKTFNETNYSIVCESFPIGVDSILGQAKSMETEPIVTSMGEKEIRPFTKTAFSGGLAPFSMPSLLYGVKTFCLTEPLGLEAWEKILGENSFNYFLNGDPDSYNCEDVITIFNQNQLIPLSGLNESKFIFECNTNFGTKTDIKIEIDSLIEQKNNCNSNIVNLQIELNDLLGIESEQDLRCGTPIDVLENLDVSMSIDVIEPDGSLTSVFEENLLEAIGTGNLYEYLTERPTDSGFYLCGQANASETWASGCTNIYFDEFSDDIMPENIEQNVSSCTPLKDSILNGLLAEASAVSSELILDDFYQSLEPTILSSNWVNYNTIISDPSIIEQITNRKIKLSLTINSTCGDICVLIDQINLDKVCERVDSDTIFLNKSPGFNLTRVIDNKKSWVENDTLVNRQFNIGNSQNQNQIRQTEYSLNNERLIINSKEIDLDVNMASAVEYDVWCYLTDNNCLLTGQTICDPCVDYGVKLFQDSWCVDFQDGEEYVFQDGFTGYGYFKSVCCGDNMLDFNSLVTSDISKVQTFEKFKHIISTELIDVKNRQTISQYPTLKALYYRYLDSTSYCGLKSAAFDYYTMEQFANLIGDYWVDLIEQVIPATTIWGSVKIYTNTLFDQQKFRYKSYSALFCENEFVDTNKVLSPVSKCSCANVGISTNIINLVNENGIPQKSITTTCDTLCIAQMNSGSEFIGTVRGPIDCVVSDWSEWSECSETGEKTRTRTIEVQPELGGIGCPILSETTTCPVDCVMSEWSEWSECDITTGVRTRTRTIISPALNGGIECGALTETAICQVDCVVSEWSEFSECSVTNEKTRTRTIITQPLNGGVSCPVLIQTTTCPVDCVLSEWSEWSTCTGGSQTRTKVIVTQPLNGGTPCGPIIETRACVVPSPIIPCNTIASSGGVGITDYSISLDNPLGGVVIFDFQPQGIVDKLEIIHVVGTNYIKKATSNMTTTGNYGPYDDVFGTRPTNIVPSNAQAMAKTQFVGNNKGLVPNRLSEFNTDTGISIITYPLTPTYQQRVWWKYTAADYANSTNVNIRITGIDGTAWRIIRICT